MSETDFLNNEKKTKAAAKKTIAKATRAPRRKIVSVKGKDLTQKITLPKSPKLAFELGVAYGKLNA